MCLSTWLDCQSLASRLHCAFDPCQIENLQLHRGRHFGDWDPIAPIRHGQLLNLGPVRVMTLTKKSADLSILPLSRRGETGRFLARSLGRSVRSIARFESLGKFLLVEASAQKFCQDLYHPHILPPPPPSNGQLPDTHTHHTYTRPAHTHTHSCSGALQVYRGLGALLGRHTYKANDSRSSFTPRKRYTARTIATIDRLSITLLKRQSRLVLGRTT